MLAPSLATMLCVLTTDAVVDPAAIDQALRRATARTFDRLDIDGCCSTNDTVLLLASGASGIAPPQTDLDDAVLRVCEDLCAQLQADAEGVTKRVIVTVTGAASEDQAVSAARSIARDSLSRPRCSARIPTGGGCSRPSAWRPGSHSTPIGSPCHSTVLRCASTEWGRRARATSTSPGPTSPSPSTSASATVKPPSGRPICRTRTSKRTRPTAHEPRRRRCRAKR